jgi:hypothetical protein
VPTRSPKPRKGPVIFINSEQPLNGFTGTIVKVETTGLNPVTDRVIAVGFLHDSTLTITRAPQDDTDPHYDLPEYERIVSDQLCRLRRPLYAYNSEFERTFLSHYFGVDLPVWHDLLAPFARAADRVGLPYPRLDQLVSTPQDLDPFAYLRTYRVPKGPDIPVLWQQYRELDDALAIEAIVEHCRSFLYREQFLLTLYGAQFFELGEVPP